MYRLLSGKIVNFNGQFENKLMKIDRIPSSLPSVNTDLEKHARICLCGIVSWPETD